MTEGFQGEVVSHGVLVELYKVRTNDVSACAASSENNVVAIY